MTQMLLHSIRPIHGSRRSSSTLRILSKLLRQFHALLVLVIKYQLELEVIHMQLMVSEEKSRSSLCM
jgi:hypothetical protein